MVKTRYPELGDLAEQRAEQIQTVQDGMQLIEQLLQVQSMDEARNLLKGNTL